MSWAADRVPYWGAMDDVERIEIRLPKKLARRLRAPSPAGGRSAWIAEAIDDRLRPVSRLEATNRSFGTWTDEDFPGLDTVDDIERWRASLWSGKPFRKSTRKRRPEIRRS